MLPFYLNEEAFDKEVMLWSVKHNPHKSGMHYIFPIEMLKNKGKESGLGSSSGPEAHKKESMTQTKLEEEEGTQPLERKKRTLSIFPQLPYQAMLTGKDVNEILSITFIIEPVENKFRTWVSLRKILNPQPLSSAIPKLAQRSEQP
jgi:hypothetical protein